MNPIGGSVASPASMSKPTPLLAPKIDPNTNDFYSLFEGMDPVDYQVVLAMKIERNSGPSVVNHGQELQKIRKITGSTENEVKDQVRLALDRLIKNRDIRYTGTNSLEIDSGNQAVHVMVEWINLRAFDNAVRSSELSLNP